MHADPEQQRTLEQAAVSEAEIGAPADVVRLATAGHDVSRSGD
jgi:hypothetical protein